MIVRSLENGVQVSPIMMRQLAALQSSSFFPLTASLISSKLHRRNA